MALRVAALLGLPTGARYTWGALPSAETNNRSQKLQFRDFFWQAFGSRVLHSALPPRGRQRGRPESNPHLLPTRMMREATS